MAEDAILAGVSHVILVLSGKGGVGKSTVATQLALSLVQAGKRVGILDIDLCGPSVPRMLSLEGSDVHQCSTGWVPVFFDASQKLAVMSIGFLLQNKDDAVIWRGPKKNAMIKQFLTDVVWGERDYLIIDTPPGTSDEHITVVEQLKKIKVDGAVVVTTPQECTNIFSTGGGESLAELCKVPFLGRIPLDPRLTKCMEEGKSYVDAYVGAPAQEAMANIVKTLLRTEKTDDEIVDRLLDRNNDSSLPLQK